MIFQQGFKAVIEWPEKDVSCLICEPDGHDHGAMAEALHAAGPTEPF